MVMYNLATERYLEMLDSFLHQPGALWWPAPPWGPPAHITPSKGSSGHFPPPQEGMGKGGESGDTMSSRCRNAGSPDWLQGVSSHQNLSPEHQTPTFNHSTATGWPHDIEPVQISVCAHFARKKAIALIHCFIWLQHLLLDKFVNTHVLMK
jgi:hypothetical protein